MTASWRLGDARMCAVLERHPDARVADLPALLDDPWLAWLDTALAEKLTEEEEE